MSAPLKGSTGSITIDTLTNQKSVAWVGSWEVTLENNTETVGPHIGDPNEYEVETSQKWSFKVSGTIPEGGDDGQDAMFAAGVNRTRPQLELATTKGKQLTFAADTTTYKKLTWKTDAKGTQTFEAEGAGPAVLADGPTE